jgi:hypothetical protein
MSKNKIIIVLLILLSIGVISLYTTYAYEDNDEELSNQHYNLMYPLKESSNKEIAVGAKEEKFVDISLKNTYENTIRYGMYYYMINPTKLPDSVTITLSEDSEDLLEDIIKPNQTRSISIRITNDSEYAINLIIGALIGFEHGEIEELVTDGEVLIK